MFIAKLIICVLVIIGCIVTRNLSDDFCDFDSIIVKILFGITIVLYIAFIVLNIITWNAMCGAYIIIFTVICTIICLSGNFYDFGDLLLAVVILFIVSAVSIWISASIYSKSCEIEEHETVNTVEYNLLAAGNVSTREDQYSTYKGIFIMQISGSSEEKDNYKFYYQDKNGDIELYSIPTEGTKLRYISKDEKPHFEKIITKKKYEKIDKHKHPDKLGAFFTLGKKDERKEEYKLYIPEGSILNTFQFDIN